MKLHLGVFFEPTLILPSCAFEIVRDGVKRAVGKCCDDVVHEAEKFDVRQAAEAADASNPKLPLYPEVGHGSSVTFR
jgi:hypothetical protein